MCLSTGLLRVNLDIERIPLWRLVTDFERVRSVMTRVPLGFRGTTSLRSVRNRSPSQRVMNLAGKIRRSLHEQARVWELILPIRSRSFWTTMRLSMTSAEG